MALSFAHEAFGLAQGAWRDPFGVRETHRRYSGRRDPTLQSEPTLGLAGNRRTHFARNGRRRDAERFPHRTSVGSNGRWSLCDEPSEQCPRGHRGDRARRDRGREGRRRQGERRRPRLCGFPLHDREDGLHHPELLRHRVCPDDRRAGAPAPPHAHGGRERCPARDGLHGDGRRAARLDDRHIGRAAQRHVPGVGQRQYGTLRFRAAGSCLSADRARRRGSHAVGPHGSRRRPLPTRRSTPGRGHLRTGQRRRHRDGRAADRGLRRAPPPETHLGRRSDRLSAAVPASAGPRASASRPRGGVC